MSRLTCYSYRWCCSAIQCCWILGALSLAILICHYVHILLYPESWVHEIASNHYGTIFQCGFYGTLLFPLSAVLLEGRMKPPTTHHKTE